MTASVDAARDEASPKRAGLPSFTLTLAVLILVYQKHAPEPIESFWIKDALDYMLWALGAVLVGQLLRQCGTSLWRFLRRLKKLAEGFTVTYNPDRGKNDRGS